VITDYPITSNAAPSYICVGGDSNLWFTMPGIGFIGRISTTALSSNGITTGFVEFPCGNETVGICEGPDGALWFCEPTANEIGRMDTSGNVTQFDIPTLGSSPYGICTGPDGNIWFCEHAASQIGKLSVGNGTINEYSITTPVAGPTDICTGPDGRLWFCETGVSQIGVLDPNNLPSGPTSNGTSSGSTTAENVGVPPVNAGSGTKCGLGSSAAVVLILAIFLMRRLRG